MRQLAATIVFTLAVAGATLAGGGLVVAPHVEAPGTPLLHDHVLSAYRFSMLMVRLQDRATRDQPHFSLDVAAGGAMAALVMAFLVFVAPRLARPDLRPAIDLVPPTICGPQWTAMLPLAPPKASLLRSS
ncbi:MAG: hypothetical protein EXR61_02290 [Chloroflexi bacterium]|nr:hypothetical protein [Chloroflexota bacterium]